jgi:hypothetical protein
LQVASSIFIVGSVPYLDFPLFGDYKFRPMPSQFAFKCNSSWWYLSLQLHVSLGMPLPTRPSAVATPILDAAGNPTYAVDGTQLFYLSTDLTSAPLSTPQLRTWLHKFNKVKFHAQPNLKIFMYCSK